MNPIAERIMDEGICPSEINEINATKIMDWVRDTDSHHTKDECTKGKDCVHAPAQMTVEWAATLVTESQHICTCGAHGAHNPGTATSVVSEFMVRWGKPIRNPKVKR